MFFGIAIGFVIFSMYKVQAAEAVDTASQMNGSIAQGLGFLAAALATGLSSLGAGIAVAFAAPAAIGAFSENKENFGKAMIFVAMGEGVAIYGLLISIIMISSGMSSLHRDSGRIRVTTGQVLFCSFSRTAWMLL